MDKEEEVKAFIEKLKSPIKKTSNHIEHLDKLASKEAEFEKKIYNAPLIGNGAGLILFTTAVATDKLPDSYLYLIPPSLWCFFIGIILVIIAGVSYIRCLSSWSTQITQLNNAQSVFLSIYDGMRKEGFKSNETKNFNFEPHVHKQIAESLKLEKSAHESKRLAHRFLIFSRILIALSALLFVVGVSFQLIPFSLSFDFVWQ